MSTRIQDKNPGQEATDISDQCRDIALAPRKPDKGARETNLQDSRLFNDRNRWLSSYRVLGMESGHGKSYDGHECLEHDLETVMSSSEAITDGPPCNARMVLAIGNSQPTGSRPMPPGKRRCLLVRSTRGVRNRRQIIAGRG